MEPNVKFKEMRKGLGLNQSEFAAKIDVSQGTITDIERGRIGVSKRVRKKITEIFGIESGYFNEIKQLKNNELNQGTESGSNQGKRAINYAYFSKFKAYLDLEYPQYNEFSRDLVNILSIGEVIDALHDTKIGDPLFFGVDNIKDAKTFKDFRDKGLKVYSETYKYKDLVHEFGQQCRKFVEELSKIKNDIEMDYDFEEWLS